MQREEPYRLTCTAAIRRDVVAFAGRVQAWLSSARVEMLPSPATKANPALCCQHVMVGLVGLLG